MTPAGSHLFAYRERAAVLLSHPGRRRTDLLSARSQRQRLAGRHRPDRAATAAWSRYTTTAGEPVIEISLSSAFVVDAALSPDSKSVAVVTMGQEEWLLPQPAADSTRWTDDAQPSGHCLPGQQTPCWIWTYEDEMRIWVLGTDSGVRHPDTPTAPSDTDLRLRPQLSEGLQLWAATASPCCSWAATGRAAATQAAWSIGPDGAALADLELRDQVLDLVRRGQLLRPAHRRRG